MITTGNWADTVDPAFRKIFDDIYTKYPEQYTNVFVVEKSDRNFEKFSTGTGFGIAKDIGEGEEIPTDDPVQGFDSTFTHKKIGDAFKVSKELLEDDLFNIIAKKPKDLALAIRRKVETDAADILINGNNTTNNTGPDGSALFADAHSREDGGATQDNLRTGAFTEGELDTIIVQMSKTLDGKGQKLMIRPDMIVCAPDLELTVRAVVESVGRTSTVNLNEPNIFSHLDVFIYNWLTDVNDYFLIDRAQNPLRFIWRRPATLERDDNISNDIARWYSTARYSTGWIDWRGLHGSFV